MCSHVAASSSALCKPPLAAEHAPLPNAKPKGPSTARVDLERRPQLAHAHRTLVQVQRHVGRYCKVANSRGGADIRLSVRSQVRGRGCGVCDAPRLVPSALARPPLGESGRGSVAGRSSALARSRSSRRCGRWRRRAARRRGPLGGSGKMLQSAAVSNSLDSEGDHSVAQASAR